MSDYLPGNLATLGPVPREDLAPVAFPTMTPELENSALALQLHLLRRHVWKIAVLVALVTTLTSVWALRIPKLFASTAVIRVDPSAPQDLVNGNQNRPITEVDTLLATESAEIQNPTVVLPVIRRLDLLHNPAMDYNPTRNASQLEVDGVPQPFLQAFLRSLDVNRPPATMLLNVNFRTRSADLSARIANALADELIAHEYATRSESLRASSQYLAQQVQELRAQMESSQSALADFERANNVVSPTDRFNLMNQRLSTLATDLDKQSSEERQLESNLALGQAGDMDALLVSDRGNALKPLVDARHAQELNFAAVAATYGPGSAAYQDAQRKLAGVNAAVQSEASHIVQQIQLEYGAQQRLTALTQQAFDSQKAALESFNAKAAQYAILKQQAESQSKLYDSLLQQMEDADVAAGYHSDNLRVVGRAQPDPIPAYPRIGLTVMLAFLGSLFVGVLATLTFGGFDRTLSDPALVSGITGERLLGSLPHMDKPSELSGLWMAPELGLRTGSQREPSYGPYAEAMFSVRTTLMLSAGTPPRTIAVTSAQPRDGKTTTSISLAVASARNGSSTILVDADLRRPSVHRALGLANRVGLGSLLQGEARLKEVLQPGPVSGLTVIAAGPRFAASSELLGNRFAPVLEELKSLYDCVIIDCPPTLGFADSLIVGPMCDAVLLVALAGETPRDYVRDVAAQLRRVRANVAGIVLNGVSSHVNSYYSYLSSYSAYYSPAESETSAEEENE